MIDREKISELRLAYKDKALAKNTLYLLDAENAVAFIAAASASDLPLLGIDGFRLSEQGAFQPDQDFSNDISDFCGTRSEFYEATKKLVTEGADENIYFQVVFEGEE